MVLVVKPGLESWAQQLPDAKASTIKVNPKKNGDSPLTMQFMLVHFTNLNDDDGM